MELIELDAPVDRVRDPGPAYSTCRAMAEEQYREDIELFAGWLESCDCERTPAKGLDGLFSTNELMLLAFHPRVPATMKADAISAVRDRYLEDHETEINNRASEMARGV
jgi:hypothetical protein